MQLNITARHMELTDGLRSHIEKELKKLQRHFHKEAEVQVTLCVEKYRHIAEVSCNVGGHLLQSKEETKDMYQSVDRSIESVGKQFKRFKSKHWDGKGKSGLPDEALIQDPAAGAEGEELEQGFNPSKPRIIRSRKYAVKPMSVDEAALQMDLLDKDFIVYTDSTSEEVNVLYRRKDGNLGLIEPVYE
ncbi:MAG: ribosome-associated translation inhibitor RaiA [Deltaproteobacteria bacterium]|nr:ribosome-associated translation inhibitor RaiA [Deltaproteobacteria bacterium]